MSHDVKVVIEIVDFRQPSALELAGIIGLLPVEASLDGEAAEVLAIRFLVSLGFTWSWKIMPL